MPSPPPAAVRPVARGTTRLVVLLAVIALWACGGAGPAEDAAPADSVDPLAAQPDRPLVADDAVRVEETFRIGPAARAEAALDRPLDLGYDPGGSLYVLDGGTPNRLLKFDAEGRFEFPFGRHEPDVDRIGRATGFAVAPWNTILMIDKAHNQLLNFLAIGTFAGSVEVHGVAMNVLPLSEFGEFYLQKWDAENRRAYVVHMRAPIDSLGTPYSIGIPPGQPVRKEARDVAFQTAVDGQDRLYVGFSDAYPVRVVGPDGATVRLVGIERPPVGKTPAAIEDERARNRREIEERLPDIPDSLKAEAAEPWPVLPLIEELEIDPVGRLWVRTNRPGPAGSTAYDVFNAEGDFLAVVRLPGAVRSTTFAPDGTLVVIDATSDASREIVGYRVRFDAAPGGAGPAGSGDARADSTVAPAPPAETPAGR